MRKRTGGLFGLFLFFVLIPHSQAMYSDDVIVHMDSGWKAAQNVAKPTGIKKADEKKHKLETHWTEDQVVRRSGPLKKWTSQTYRRRFRYTIQLTQQHELLHFEILGEFEQKPAQSPPQAPWRKAPPFSEDYDVERSVFMQILGELQKLH